MDSRDKYKQGIVEVRKAASAEFPFTPRLFDAGEIGRRIYVAMEYFHGQSLKNWWTSISPEFAWRYVIAHKIDHLTRKLVDRGIIHGDLHWGNVLVHSRHDRLPQFRREEFADTEVLLLCMRQEEIEFKIVDFGTSYFSEKGFSISRHWRVYEELIDKLLWPIEMRYIWSHTKPVGETDSVKMAEWFSGYLHWMYWILMHAFECAKIRPLWHGQDNLILTVEGHRYLRDLIGRHQLTEHDVEMMRPWVTVHDYYHTGML